MKQLIQKNLTYFTFVLFLMTISTVVAAQNTQPTATDDYFFTTVNTPVTGNLLANDSDSNGDNLFINTTPITSPLQGAVTISSDGSTIYTPPTGFTGGDAFTYLICDDGSPVMCDTATVYINISNITGNCNILPDTISNTQTSNCYNDIVLCLPIPFTNNPYDIYVDGQLHYDDYNHYNYGGCGNDSSAVYDMDSILLTGPWQVVYTENNYSFNVTTINNVASFSDLVDSLNYYNGWWNPWTFDATNNKISREGQSFGHMQFTNLTTMVSASVTSSFYISSILLRVSSTAQLLTITDGTCVENVVLDFSCYPSIDSVSEAPVSSCANTDGAITVHAKGIGSIEYQLYDPFTSTYGAWQTSATFTNLQGSNDYKVRVRNAGEIQNSYHENNYFDLRGADKPQIQGLTHFGNTLTVHATGALPLEYSYRHSSSYTAYQAINQFSPYSYSSSYKRVKVRYNNGSCEVLGYLQMNASSSSITAGTDSIIAPSYNTYTINVLVNDSHISGATLVTTPQSLSNTNGTVTLDAAGNLSVNTAYYDVGNFTFNYQVCEQGSSIVCTTGSVTINSNDPVTGYTSRSIPYGGTTILSLGTGDLAPSPSHSGTPLETMTSVAQVVTSYMIGSNTLRVYYDAHTIGTDTTSFVMSNGIATDTTHLILTVYPPNSVSTDDDTMYYNINMPATYNIIADDYYDTLSVLDVNPVSNPANGTVVIDLQGNATYTPNAGFTGSDTFQYRICATYGTVVYCDTSTVFVLNAAVLPLSITNVAVTSPTCGFNDGSITVTALGGSGVYEYSVDTGLTWQSSSIFNNLAAGPYNIHVRDGNTSVGYINNYVGLYSTGEPVYSGVAYSSGTLIVNATGNPALTLEYSVDCGSTWQTSNTFTGITPGNYCIVIRYNNVTNCHVYNNETINATAALAINSIGRIDATCYQPQGGKITINATGGTGNYQYQITGSSVQSSNVFNNLASGSYVVTVTDGISTVTSNTIIGNYNPLSYHAYNLNNDSLHIYTMGSNVSTVEYSIDCGTTWQTSNVFHPVTQGTYCVGLRYSNGGCENYYNNYFGDTLTLDSVSTIPATCGSSDGSITIHASNGAGTYEYSIDSGLTWQANNIFPNIAAGWYPIYVRDDSTTTTISHVNVYDVGTPNYISSTFNAGTITVTASGTNPLEYSLDCGATWQTSNVFTGMSAGSYCIGMRYTNSSCVIYENTTLGVTPSTLAITNIIKTNTNCNQATGTISITATGGTGNYQYKITGYPWQTVDTFSNLSPGTYHISVKDGVDSIGYSANPVIITNLASPVITGINYSYDTLVINATGGLPMEYSIDCGMTWQSSNVFFPGVSGNVCLGVRFANGNCPVLSNITITNNSPIAVNDTATFVKAGYQSLDIIYNDYDAENNALFTVPQTVFYGTDSMTLDNNGQMTIPTNALNFGSYMINYQLCEVYNPNNCSQGSVYFNITPPTSTLHDTIAIGSYQVICIPDNLPGTPTSLNITATSSMTNAVIDSVVGTCLYVYADNYGNDSIAVVMCDNFGFCDTTLVYLNVQDGVWPGDTDDDTDVNVFDLLNIGLGYGLTGTPRNSISNTWTGFVTPKWNTATPISNIDYRHADCNGDGVINANDTAALLLNYNQSYQRGGNGSSTGVPLYVQGDTSNNNNGPHFSLPIVFGDPNNQGVNIYGGAFSINYDTTFIKKNSVSIVFDNSWVGVNNTDMISIYKNFGNQQQVDGAFTRINGTNITGHGILGMLNFTIKDDILQRNGFNADSVIIGMNVFSTKFISFNEMPIDIDERSSGLMITSTKKAPNLAQFVSIFPNPAQDYTIIESPKYAIEQVSIIDITGKVIHQEKIAHQNNITLNVSPYPSGVYTIQLVTPEGIATKRLTIVK